MKTVWVLVDTSKAGRRYQSLKKVNCHRQFRGYRPILLVTAGDSFFFGCPE
jgi:hypothetical protein